MKRLGALLLVILLGIGLITHLNDLSDQGLFKAFGDSDIVSELSRKFINKSVTSEIGESEEVIYGETTDPETGSANIVTSIIANYRSFDTLGEVTVLFVASLGVSLLLGGYNRKRYDFGFKPNFMLKTGSRALFGIILISGVSMAIHGHLTPGGGFPGGAMIAASLLLLYLADDEFRTNIQSFKVLEGVMGTFYVAIGLVGLFTAGYFLKDFLPTGTVGELFSAGIVPIVYVIVGLKVGAELTGILDNFMTEEVS